MEAESGDDHGVAQVTGLRTCSSKRKRKSKKNKKGFEVERCGSLAPSDFKYYFPYPINASFLDDDEFFHLKDSPPKLNHIYPPGMKSDLKIVKDKRLEVDVVSLLSDFGKRDYLVRNDGTKVPLADSITGKYLLICCFSIPLITGRFEANVCRQMIKAYSNLKASANCNNFEMVMVAKIATMVDEEEEEAAFNHFFSAFPCLAIPFWDTKCRDFLCYSLGVHVHPGTCNRGSLLLDPDQMVLDVSSCNLFSLHGGSSFPFTREHQEALYIEDQNFKHRVIAGHMSLVELFGADLLLQNSDSNNSEEAASVSVSELSKKKCLGVYLCYTGNFMEELNTVYKQCRANNLEFEIVVVYMGTLWSDTAPFVQAVKRGLEKHKISSWWVLPYVDDELILRMYRLHQVEFTDVVITLADGVGDLMGGDLMTIYEQTYPFTRKKRVDDTIKYLRSLTLDSLLTTTTRKKGYQLKGKKVLLCMDEGGELYDELLEFYNQILNDNYSHFQVVYVSLYKRFIRDHSTPESWMILRSGVGTELADKLFLKHEAEPRWPHIIAFGDDGRIRSRCLQDRLLDNNGSLFDDALLQEIVCDIIHGDNTVCLTLFLTTFSLLSLKNLLRCCQFISRLDCPVFNMPSIYTCHFISLFF